MISDLEISALKQACKSSPSQRSPSDLKILLNFTKEIKLFRDLKAKQGEPAHISCCQYLLYEFIEANEWVFHHGEVGSKFYIIISGQVGIQIPVSENGKLQYTEIMTFTDGSSFGELALESSKPRSASAICKSDCHFLILLKKDYARLMQRLVTEKKIEMLEFLQSLPAFGKLNKLVLGKLLYNIREITFSKGQYLFREGEAAREIWIVYQGECKMCKLLERQQNSISLKKIVRKQMHTAKRVGRGAMIGEEDVINKSVHSYSCICSSDTVTLYVIPAADFFVRITAEQPLRYLKSVSKDKRTFLNDWSQFRGSLDKFFTGEKLENKGKIRKKESLTTVNSVEKLNSAVSERKKLLSRNSSIGVMEISKACSSTRGYSRKDIGENSLQALILKHETRPGTIESWRPPTTAPPVLRISHKRIR
jgi:CRP-like cAMP-binding protein